MSTRIIGIILAVVSALVFVWHIAQRGSEPHPVWALIAGATLIFGLWLALPRRQRR